MIAILLANAVYNLKQLQEVLEQSSTEEYNENLEILFQSTIGMHVRHIVEFFQCLEKGVHSGKVNYDARLRDIRIEKDKNYAIATIKDIIEGVKIFEENKNLLLCASQDLGHMQYEIPTNVWRELSYLIEHSIHHMAIIKIAYESNYKHIRIDEKFGFAYSTIKYKQDVHSKLSAG